MTAYAEFRQAFNNDPEDQRIVFHGLQYIIHTYDGRQWTASDVQKADLFFATHCTGFTEFPFPRDLFHKIVHERQGWFPITIEALPEGTVIYPVLFLFHDSS